ncbi:MAG: hypothetical protein ACP5VR_08755 [Acidimicrobiales bacterium]
MAVRAALAELAALLYVLSVRSGPPSSDGPTIVPEAKAVTGGNLDLRGWPLSFSSIWTVDVPVYVLAVALTRSANPEYSRYFKPAVVFGAVLGGHLLSREPVLPARAVSHKRLRLSRLSEQLASPLVRASN